MGEADVLLVEDNQGDANLVRLAIDNRGLPVTLHVARTGEAALDWLYGRGDETGNPRPEIILLDLNLAAVSGQAVLEELKSDTEMRHIPVIVISGSRYEEDIQAAYNNHANAFLVKPVNPREF